MSVHQHYDLVVIGSGPAGQKAALQAAKVGKRVALIEKNTLLGGVCVLDGTLPSKSFRESVYRWALGSRGVIGQALESYPEMEKIFPQMRRLLKRKERVVQSECLVIRDQLVRNGVEIWHGKAKLIGAHEVLCQKEKGKTHSFHADVIVLAVGTSPVAHPNAPIDGQVVFHSDNILSIKKIPKKMAMIGGGVIGCEYASMFLMAGTEVLLMDRRKELLRFLDREMVHYLLKILEQFGLQVHYETSLEKLDLLENGARVCLEGGACFEVDAVLVSMGRNGNTKDLGLEKVGIVPDKRGWIPVNAHFQTEVPHIYAVGDVIGYPALASTGMEQGRRAVCHGFSIPLEKTELPELYPYGIYTIPEVAALGETEDALKKKNIAYVCGRAFYKEIARGQIIGDRWGMLKLLVSKHDQRILGVHIVGDQASDLIHIGQAVMVLGGKLSYFIENIFNYPTFAEAYKTAAFDAINHFSDLEKTK